MDKIIGKNIALRLVEIEDAEFIINLRKSREKFLSQGTQKLEDQQNWLKQYKVREQLRQEFYFIIEHANKNVGALRIYDLKPDSFCWGSWAIINNSPTNCGIESFLLILDFGFKKLNYSNCHFDVLKNNHKLVKFHKSTGAKVYKEDEKHLYFKLDLATFEKIQNKYQKFLR